MNSTVETIRARFEEGCRQRGVDPAKEVETLAGPGAGVEEFWQRVKTNLQAGRVRMVFVADFSGPAFVSAQSGDEKLVVSRIRGIATKHGAGRRSVAPKGVCFLGS